MTKRYHSRHPVFFSFVIPSAVEGSRRKPHDLQRRTFPQINLQRRTRTILTQSNLAFPNYGEGVGIADGRGQIATKTYASRHPERSRGIQA